MELSRDGNARSAIERDVERATKNLRDIHASVTGWDDTRIMALIPAVRGSEPFLRYSIPRLLAQVEATGKRADVLYGTNVTAASW